MPAQPLHIVAPVSSAAEARLAIEAGADELYCGAMFDDWAAAFGEADLLSRRQGRLTHVRSKKELAAIAKVALVRGVPVALTLNSRYSPAQEVAVLDLATTWKELGGTAALVSDLGVLLALRDSGSALRRHVSLLAGVWNSAAAEFFAQLGAARIVLPRHLALTEIQALINAGPTIEYEALVMNQKCQFVDGMCGFYHAVRLPDDVPAVFDYSVSDGSDLPRAWSYDPAYEGHGCEIYYETDRGPVRHVRRDDVSTPYCAACQLADLSQAGVRFFKIAGRGYPSEMITRCIRFLKRAVELGHASTSSPATRNQIRDSYGATFGSSCAGARCYYAEEILER